MSRTDRPATLAVDFGTSNSAAACLEDGRIRRLSIEPGAETLPTAVFFPADKGRMRIGSDATSALIAGEEGRYMRALKSVLGTGLFHEQRLIGGRRRTLAEVVTAFLVTLKNRAEAAAGRRFDAVLSGRPVHFHTADPERDARAEADLRACYHAAGFETVDFCPEPEAAALATHGMGRAGGTGLIVDIGGGTSDFTLYRRAGAGIEIVASHGIRLGGTDFDHAVSMRHAMPFLGHGGTLRRDFGEGLLPVPNALYADLSTWAKIPFLYTPETRRQVADMRRVATDPKAIGRLVTVIEEELGHELAFSVEAGKIAANARAADSAIAMGFVAPGLTAPIDADTLSAALEVHGAALHDAMAETLALSGVAPEDVDSVVLVGGSSLMRLVAETAQDLLPGATQHRSEAFTAVVDGLALATAEG